MNFRKSKMDQTSDYTAVFIWTYKATRAHSTWETKAHRSCLFVGEKKILFCFIFFPFSSFINDGVPFHT